MNNVALMVDLVGRPLSPRASLKAFIGVGGFGVLEGKWTLALVI
jgi:hypothetical protein